MADNSATNMGFNASGYKKSVDLLKKAYPEHFSYLQNMFNSGKLKHAYCLSGGVEGAQYAFSEYLVSLYIQAKHHPDFLVLPLLKTNKVGSDVAAPKRITIEDVRVMRQHLSKKAVSAAKKIVILNDADRITIEAVNALLKIVEEPSGQTLILLNTAYPELLVGTLRSRVETIHLPRLSHARVGQIILDYYKQPHNMNELETMTHLIDGQFSRLQQICLADNKKKIAWWNTESHFWIKFMLGNKVERNDLIQQIPDEDSAFMQKLAFLETVLHDVLLCAMNNQSAICLFEHRAEITKLSDKLNITTVTQKIKKIKELQLMTQAQTNKKMILQYLILDL